MINYKNKVDESAVYDYNKGIFSMDNFICYISINIRRRHFMEYNKFNHLINEVNNKFNEIWDI